MKKAVLLGSLALMLSPLLPWYDQRNSVGIGETYLGIEGPLFAIGFLLLACGAVSFFNLFLPLMGRQFFKLKKRGGTTALALAGQGFLLLLLANSIFYHPDFGLNVSTKTTRFGMVLAFGALGMMAISGWWTQRTEHEEDDVEDFMRPVESTPAAPSVLTYSPDYEPSREPTRVSPPSYSAPLNSNASGSSQATSGVDPLTLDPKTRYKIMRSQGRYSSAAQNNLWGSGTGSAYSSRQGDYENDY